MLRITTSRPWATASVVAASVVAASAATAQGIYSPSVVHGTSRSAPIAQPAAPAPGATSIAPSVVLGWGGLPPSVGAPTGSWAPVQPVVPGYAYAVPGHPVRVVPMPVYPPSSYGSTVLGPYPSSPYRPDPSSGPLHRWSTP